ncbi:gamma-glutamyl-gamma-aminobutyrate hydrolase family protein [Hyphomicrobium sp.]|uniref:gamma-glutamyl-gamma-aminobutyrate hydrolase family protein n=1 Tax=Hyphomicrobium sp. TaxID=82 RepID=UPI000F9E7C2E|nr:gamma-glutamyl-gamma-aminobutyrate hydrolase family protein [Hyphomicrobium sp.]RUO97915.1 MAG: gamma-glutamyl-gamma-aminobutyrate hydrolase family protein [Hyphomicrobium sp.]
MSRPVVVIPCSTETVSGLISDTVGRKYCAAVAEGSECQPLLLPVGKGLSDIGSVLAIASGILLTGAISNVHPENYGLEEPVLPEAIDRDRDAVTLPLIRAAVERKVPIMAICRGFQELNVALGGSLHQAVHTVEGFADHREPKVTDFDVMFAPRHPVTLTGELKTWLGQDRIIVNSLHGQGIRDLAKPLVAEAFAEDGLVEAARVAAGNPFSLGVQWHPEWQLRSNPASLALFRRFGDAARGMIAKGQAA